MTQTRLAKQQVAEEMIRVIQLCKDARNAPNAYGYLPDIIDSLRLMLNDLRAPSMDSQENRRRARSDVGRIALDGVEFCYSELGISIFNVINDYADSQDD